MLAVINCNDELSLQVQASCHQMTNTCNLGHVKCLKVPTLLLIKVS